MNGNHIDIGTIQAFLDGETHPEKSLKISEHIGGCDPCAILLAQAEEENSMVFSVLDRELNSLVPTQRLWSRINESIADEKSRMSVWQRFTAFVSANLANPSFAAAMGILLVVGMVGAIWMNQPGATSGNDIAANSNQQAVPTTSDDKVYVNVTTTDGDIASNPKGKINETKLSPQEIKRMVITANYTERGPKKVDAVPASFAPQFLPGEESYIKTINELEQNFTAQNAGLKASSQVSYQRDLAVVDDSIQKMKQVVRKNPKNQAAKQVLYSSYQDKIDLLNSAAQRDELMASLQ
ncbi:MAG TPA: hypothetical protein VK612_00900 [Pyrinomonadaceae bacterium]|nr:hypothetical protein [Pyrinomonadaceae bacterium]